MPTSDSGIDTIEEVLEALDTIIARALDEGGRVGYFAAVYRTVTAKIGRGSRPGSLTTASGWSGLMSRSPTATSRR
jgi:hypothetical protein